jgi:alkylation response protein AidB-like acyl-CoA dehydrogenase
LKVIDFTLTDEQKAFQKVVRDFAQNEIAPIAPQLDEEARHSPEVVEGYFKLGFLHYAVAEEYGGLKNTAGQVWEPSRVCSSVRNWALQTRARLQIWGATHWVLCPSLSLEAPN